MGIFLWSERLNKTVLYAVCVSKEKVLIWSGCIVLCITGAGGILAQEKMLPVSMESYSNTQVMNNNDMTVLFINRHRNVPFLIVAVMKPTQGESMTKLVLPRKPVLVRGQETRPDEGVEIMRGVYPELEYLVVEPLMAFPWTPALFAGTYDGSVYQAAREKAMEEGLARIQKGGGYWFSIERYPRPGGFLSRKEDFLIVVDPKPGVQLEMMNGRNDVESVRLERRAIDLGPSAERQRTTVTSIPSPVLRALKG